MDGDVILALSRDLQAGLTDGLHHAGAIRDALGRHKAREILVDALTPLSQPEALLRPLRGLCKLSGAFWVVGPRPAVREVQGVPERRIGAFPTGGRDVQRPPAAKLHARRYKMKLCTSALGMAVADPCDVILLRVQPGEGKTLESVHRLALLVLGRRILGREGQNPVRVGPLAVNAVDQVAGLVHIAPDYLGRRMAPAFLTGQIFRHLTPATAAPARELNQHRRASHVLPGSPPTHGRSQQAGSAAPRSQAAVGG